MKLLIKQLVKLGRMFKSLKKLDDKCAFVDFKNRLDRMKLRNDYSMQKRVKGREKHQERI